MSDFGAEGLHWAPPLRFDDGEQMSMELCRAALLACAKLDIDATDFEANVQSITGRLLKRELLLLDLVVCLKEQLTSGVEAARARGLNLLARVVKGIRSELTENEQQVLSGFFTSRLADWPSLNSALLGCLNLLQGAPICEPVVLSVGNAFFAEVQVQDLKRSDRQLALEVLGLLIKDHGSCLGRNGVDLVQGTVAAIDGEKDPRCLLTAFACIPSLVEVYNDPGMDVGPFISGAEDLFDVVACYFPISFSHATSDTHGIEKNDLSTALHAAMAASPHFSEHCIPLLLEKMSSSLRQAKLDALACLPVCCGAYGWQCMAEHLSAIWLALKSDIVPKTGMHGLDQIENHSSDPMRNEIGACLRSCILVLNKDPDASSGECLDDMILSEPCMTDFLTVFRETSSREQWTRAEPLIDKVSWLVAVVGSSGGTACIKTFKTVIKPLLDMANLPRNESDTFFFETFFGVIESLLRSIRTSAHDFGWTDPGIGDWLKHIHSIIQECSSRGPCTPMVQATSLQLCLFPPEWQVLSEEQWLTDVRRILFPVMDAPAVAECSDRLHKLASEAIRHLVTGEHEQKICCHFVTVIVPEQGSFRFGAPALDILKNGCEVSTKFSESVLCRFAGFLQGLTKRGTQAQESFDSADLVSLLDFVSLELMERVGDVSRENLGLVGEAVVSAVSHTDEIPIPSSAMASFARVLNRLTAICTLESSQREIASAANALLSRATNTPAGPGIEWPMVVPCCLVGLKPNVLDAPQTIACLQQCSRHALCSFPMISQAFAPAVASLANKAPDNSWWQSTVADMCNSLLFPALSSAQVDRQAVVCLGWVLRGLAMRGKSRELESTVLNRVLDLVEQHPMGEAAGWENGLVGEAVSIFDIVVRKGGVREECCFLDEAMHPRASRLWRQRAFSACLTEMMARLEQCSEQGKGSGVLLLALGYLLKGAGPGLVRLELGTLFPKLLNIIDALFARSKLKGVELQIANVSLLGEFITQESFHSLYRDCFKDVLDALLKSCRWPCSVTVRKKALECLQALVGVSQDQCKIHRRKVVCILKECVDDNKRCVRQRAAQCRRAWEGM